ncbi:hypothetical protein LOTGIDRAFT_164618 [Lottia gigantea]|uniref:CARD domain-containing protein n=1 Tax=Lottia gigantea TaxID=225164 RepID=V3ZFJ7_LOTGI|nr:hypothetical protein LOTGIDRAFT_164618 [Lottia gigantea]ESO89923.1 hypothetical protein LOTGIDRAFT_164618 [Lottia gigantea]
MTKTNMSGHDSSSVMLTEQLSTNNDLVETLDTEPVFDYLLQHGVLNTDVVDGICNEDTKLGRNSALLQHLDDNGGTARALFINALRQSGQHKLASTIDTSQRIIPATGYWDKPRHKGEVKIKIGIKSLKLLVPKTDSPERNRYCVASDTPQKLHKSYENMLMLDNIDSVSRSRKILEYSYRKDDEDEIPAKKSCWCMCFPMFCRPKKRKEKKYEIRTEKKKMSEKDVKKKQKSKEPEASRMLEYPEKCAEHQIVEKRPPKNSNREQQNRVSYLRGEEPLSSTSYDQRRNSGSPRKELQTDIVGYKNNRNDSKRNVRYKENVVPLIMQYDNQNESIELRIQDENSSPRRTQTPTKKINTNNNRTPKGVEMCEKWKIEGKVFEEKLTEFCALFELRAMQEAIMKYFECDRGTLFFESGTDGSSVYICNICTSVKQLTELERDYKEGKVQSDLYRILLKNDMQIQMAVPGIEFSTVIDEDQFTKVREELS